MILDDDFRMDKELAKIVFGALTGPEELKEYSACLLEKYGVSVEPEPTLIEIARETQALAIGLDTISDELRDQRLKAILKKIVAVVPFETVSDEQSDSISERFSSLGELN